LLISDLIARAAEYTLNTIRLSFSQERKMAKQRRRGTALSDKTKEEKDETLSRKKPHLEQLAAHALELSVAASNLRRHVAVMSAPPTVTRSWIENCVLRNTNENSLDATIKHAGGSGDDDPLHAVFTYCKQCCPGLIHIDDVYAYDRRKRIKTLRDYERFLEKYYKDHGTEVDKDH
jgi:hypothetical protein